MTDGYGTHINPGDVLVSDYTGRTVEYIGEGYTHSNRSGGTVHAAIFKAIDWTPEESADYLFKVVSSVLAKVSVWRKLPQG